MRLITTTIQLAALLAFMACPFVWAAGLGLWN